MSNGAEPFRVGFLNESTVFSRSIGDMIEFRFEEAVASGEVDRPIELVVRSGLGLPHGTAKAVRDAWTALANEGVLIIWVPASRTTASRSFRFSKPDTLPPSTSLARPARVGATAFITSSERCTAMGR